MVRISNKCSETLIKKLFLTRMIPCRVRMPLLRSFITLKTHSRCSTPLNRCTTSSSNPKSPPSRWGCPSSPSKPFKIQIRHLWPLMKLNGLLTWRTIIKNQRRCPSTGDSSAWMTPAPRAHRRLCLSRCKYIPRITYRGTQIMVKDRNKIWRTFKMGNKKWWCLSLPLDNLGKA